MKCSSVWNSARQQYDTSDDKRRIYIYMIELFRSGYFVDSAKCEEEKKKNKKLDMY